MLRPDALTDELGAKSLDRLERTELQVGGELQEHICPRVDEATIWPPLIFQPPARAGECPDNRAPCEILVAAEVELFNQLNVHGHPSLVGGAKTTCPSCWRQ